MKTVIASVLAALALVAVVGASVHVPDVCPEQAPAAVTVSDLDQLIAKHMDSCTDRLKGSVPEADARRYCASIVSGQ